MPEDIRALTELEKAQQAASDARRVAEIAATGTAELAETLKAADDARRKLQEALAHCCAKIEALRRHNDSLRARIKTLEADAEGLKLLAKDAMAGAEAVRREGIEALEEARQLVKKKSS